MARKPSKESLSRIAAELGISVSSVSRAVNNRAGVSEELRRTVAEALRRHPVDLRGSGGRRDKVGVILPAGEITQYTSQVLSGVLDGLEAADLDGGVIMQRPGERESLLSRLRDQQFAGAISIIPELKGPDFQELARAGLPVMLVDEQAPDSPFGWVDHDARSGGRQATEYLLQCGHRKIGYVWALPERSNHQSRYLGYREALAAAGVPFEENWAAPFRRGAQMESGANQLAAILDAVPGVTAVIAGNDEYALGVLSEAVRRGLKIPEDLSVIGFDDYEMSRFINPKLTTVRHPMRRAGQLAAEAMAHTLKNGVPVFRTRLVLPVELIVRESTCCSKQP